MAGASEPGQNLRRGSKLCGSGRKSGGQLAEAVGKEISDSSLIQIFSNLLKDGEPDVKVVAVQSLSKFIKFLSPEKLQNIVPLLQVLARDQNAQVKSIAIKKTIIRLGQAAEVIGVISTLIPKDHSQSKLASYLQEMFQDENQDVRKGAAVAAGKFAEAVGVEGMNTFIPSLKQAMEDSKWRVRKAVLATVI